MTLEEEMYLQEEQAMAYKSMGDKLSVNMSVEQQFRAMQDYHMSDYHRQLAEWLRELKKWRALRDSINMLCDVDCEYPQYRESGTMCDACPIGTVKEYFEQIFDGR